MADRTVDVRDRATGAADDVVMVVPNPRLVPSDRAGGLDVANQTGAGEGPKNVINRLMRNIRQIGAHGLDDRVRVGMRVLVDRIENGHPGTGYPEIHISQESLVFRG